MNKKNILLIEDDAEISRLTAMYLEAEGFDVSAIYDGNLALDAIKQCAPDIVILDLMLPGMGGLAICKQARVFYNGPILVLTACNDDVSEVTLLKSGADDYLTKPLKPHVLVARLEALLRRYHRPAQPKSKKIEPISFNEDTNQILFKGKCIKLTLAEFEMLKILNTNAGNIVSREECCQALRGIEYDFSNRSIDMRISGLRKKLSDDTPPYKIIVTIRNKGYKLINE